MISKSLRETAEIARNFARGIEPRPTGAAVVALYGDLGSGKTTFAKSFAEALGIPSEEVTSPTFVIEKRFDVGSHAHFKKFVHIDAYRIEKLSDVSRIGWNETIADPESLVLIEWPENIGEALPADAIKVYFKFVDENTREVEFK
jgi:tRNA threonylcarbamoyladenosine biosynthesis protein TsaE